VVLALVLVLVLVLVAEWYFLSFLD